MQAVIFDIDHTLFAANNKVLHDGVVDLLAILKRLGVRIAAISNDDHRVLVRLDEAGIRQYFGSVLCSANIDEPKIPDGVYRVLQELGALGHQTSLVSHAHADILLGKEAGLAKTIGVSHGHQNERALERAGADHIVASLPAVLDVLG